MKSCLRPSSDMPTHAVIYRAWGDRVGGGVHAHSNATVTWAQAGRSIPCYWTTQVDYCHGEVPCMQRLTEAEIEETYELNADNVIVEGFAGLFPIAVPGCLVRNRGPFSWGKDAVQAACHAKVVEECVLMALRTEQLNPVAEPAPQ